MTNVQAQRLPWAWQAEALSAVRHQARVMLIGPAGSGKSTVARWAFNAAREDEAALFVSSSLPWAPDDKRPYVALTNRLLRESDWDSTKAAIHATTTPDVVTSPHSLRRLIGRRWDLIVCDGVDEWALEAQQAVGSLIREVRPKRVLVTSRWQTAARALVSGALVFEAPPPARVGGIEELPYRERPSEGEVRSRISALAEFVGSRVDRFGLRRVNEAWASSPFAAQQMALRQLAALRPERNVAAHTVRHGRDDDLLIFVVQGLELIIDAIDKLEDDSHRDRLLDLLRTPSDAGGERWVVTSEPATVEYLTSALEGWGTAGLGVERDLFAAGVRLSNDSDLVDLQPQFATELVHYDLPSTTIVTERVRAIRAGSDAPLKQWGLVRVGDSRARRVLRAVEHK